MLITIFLERGEKYFILLHFTRDDSLPQQHVFSLVIG